MCCNPCSRRSSIVWMSLLKKPMTAHFLEDDDFKNDRQSKRFPRTPLISGLVPRRQGRRRPLGSLQPSDHNAENHQSVARWQELLLFALLQRLTACRQQTGWLTV